MLSGEDPGGFFPVSRASIYSVLFRYKKNKGFVWSIFHGDADIILELRNFYLTLDGHPDDLLDDEEMFHLCEILAGNFNAKSASGKEILSLQQQISSVLRFDCLSILKSEKLFNPDFFSLISEWPEETLDQFHEKLTDYHFLQSLSLLIKNKMADIGIVNRLMLLNDYDLESMRKVLIVLERYNLLNLKSLPLFFKSDISPDVLLLDELDHYNDDTTYDMRYVLFEEFLQYYYLKIPRYRFARMKYLQRAYVDPDKKIPKLSYAGFCKRQEKDINLLFIGLQKMGIQIDFSLIDKNCVGILKELDITAIHIQFKLDVRTDYLNKYFREILYVYSSQQACLWYSILPFFVKNHQLWSNYSELIQANPYRRLLFQSIFKFQQTLQKELVGHETFLLIENLFSSIAVHKNKLQGKVTSIANQCIDCLIHTRHELSDGVIDYLIESKDFILVLGDFLNNNEKDFDEYVQFIMAKEEMLEKSRMLAQVYRQKKFMLFPTDDVSIEILRYINLFPKVNSVNSNKLANETWNSLEKERAQQSLAKRPR